MNKIVKEVLNKLESLNYSAYIVGGYVRDYLLEKESTDYDICTSAPIKVIRELFPGKVNLGSSLNFKVKELNIDITTYRIEENYLNRKPTIHYTKELISDLQRRDFTINAICMDKNGVIIDKLNGINDLNQKLIRIIGNCAQKLQDDPLRILRAIRFATILNFNLDEELSSNLYKYGYLIETLSTYRLKEELDKILLSSNYQLGLNLLKKYNLTQYLKIDYSNIIYTNDLCGMWSQITLNKDFPFTKLEKKNIVMINEIVKSNVINSETIYKYGLYISLVASPILGISKKDIEKIYQSMPIHKKSDLAISFLEIKELLQTNPQNVKKMEDLIIKAILNNELKNEKELLKRYIIENKAMSYE